MKSQALLSKIGFMAMMTLASSFPLAQAQEKVAEKPAEKSSEKLTSNNKIEELFIWKISDELKLSTKEEKSFADLFRNLNREKSNLAHLQDDTLTKIAGSAKAKDRDSALGEYRKQIQSYDRIQMREFDEMKKILGSERFAKYLTVKRDLTNKVKSLLTEKSEKKDSELPAPKVIEE